MTGNRKKPSRTAKKTSEQTATRRSRALRDIGNNAEQDSNRIDDCNDEPSKNKKSEMADPPRNTKRQRKTKQSYVEVPIASDDDESIIGDDGNSNASSYSNESRKTGKKKVGQSMAPSTKARTNRKTKVPKTKGSSIGKLVQTVKVSLSPSVRSIDVSPMTEQDDTIILRDWRVSGALDY